VLADPPPAVAEPQQPAPQTPGATPLGAEPNAPDTNHVALGPACSKCGAPMNPDQDWCLQCGAGAPGSLDAGGPSWRSAAAILTATAVLVLGAAAAAYAALNKEDAHKSPTTVVAVATTPTAATPTPATPITPTPTTPGAATPTPKASETPGAANPLVSTGSAKPPKIPLTAPTPKSSAPTTTSTEPSSTTTPASGKESGGEPASEPQPAAIVLDPDAASTYNPYGYPASEFGDPSLAIDGDTSTEWTARVNPAVAPKMAEGLVIDLHTPERLAAVELVTSTPGMSIQVYGAKTSSLPTSITDPSWVQLTPYLTVKKRHERIKLQDSGKGFRFVTLWISKASAASVGTPSKEVPPTHVSVNELELFPATG
jgi:hypothetical protein